MAGINPLLKGLSEEDIRRIEDHVMRQEFAFNDLDEVMHQGHEDGRSVEEYANNGYFITDVIQDSVTHHSSSADGIGQVRNDYEGYDEDAW